MSQNRSLLSDISTKKSQQLKQQLKMLPPTNHQSEALRPPCQVYKLIQSGQVNKCTMADLVYYIKDKATKAHNNGELFMIQSTDARKQYQSDMESFEKRVTNQQEHLKAYVSELEQELGKWKKDIKTIGDETMMNVCAEIDKHYFETSNKFQNEYDKLAQLCKTLKDKMKFQNKLKLRIIWRNLIMN